MHPNCHVKIWQQLNNDEPKDISDYPEGAKLIAYYADEGLVRKINEVKLELSQTLFNPDNVITYMVEIRSATATIQQRKLTISITDQ